MNRRRPVGPAPSLVPAGQQAWLALARRVVIGVTGACVVLLGLVLVPLPGPGWPIVFLGCVVLSSEFAWAERVRREVEVRAAGVLRRSAAAPRSVRLALGVASVASVLVPLWLLVRLL